MTLNFERIIIAFLCVAYALMYGEKERSNNIYGKERVKEIEIEDFNYKSH